MTWEEWLVQWYENREKLLKIKELMERDNKTSYRERQYEA